MVAAGPVQSQGHMLEHLVAADLLFNIVVQNLLMWVVEAAAPQE